MLKRPITYKDLDDNVITEDFYFNVTKAELAEFEFSMDGGFSEYLKQIVAAKNGGQIMAVFKKIILVSIGRRSEDNKRFIKSQEIRDAFEQSDAYSALFMELCTDAEAGAEFVRAIMPADVVSSVDAGGTMVDTLGLPPGDEPTWISEGRVPAQDELKNATPDQLREAFRRQQAANTATSAPTS